MTEGAGLASMTGYARATGAGEDARFVVDLRSVNARSLDLRTRLPPGLDYLEGEIRKRADRYLARGAVTFVLTLERTTAAGDVIVNHRALETVLAAIADIRQRVETAPPTPDGILGLKGIIEQREPSLGPDGEETLRAGILEAADRAFALLAANRREEGGRLRVALDAHLDEIEQLISKAESNPARSRTSIEARLQAQVQELAGREVALDPSRLAQEALILATKADIREELDRLTAHVAAARSLLAGGGPVGRKLDFLAQEFNREANTLCAKSNAVELTAIGLDLKAAIDQLREQVQNIE
jgi:uncharacterized protein (TIGR00255 family)